MLMFGAIAYQWQTLQLIASEQRLPSKKDIQHWPEFYVQLCHEAGHIFCTVLQLLRNKENLSIWSQSCKPFSHHNINKLEHFHPSLPSDIRLRRKYLSGPTLQLIFGSVGEKFTNAILLSRKFQSINTLAYFSLMIGDREKSFIAICWIQLFS